MKKLLLMVILLCVANISLHAQNVTVTLSIAAGSGIATGTSIPLLSFKIGAVQPTLTTYVGAPATAAKSQFTPLTLYKNIDATTPLLFLDCALGKSIPNVTLTVYQNSAVLFQIILEKVYISTINDDSTNSDGGSPLETFSLSYGTIGWQYLPAGGPPVNGGFDLITNRPVGWSQLQNSIGSSSD